MRKLELIPKPLELNSQDIAIQQQKKEGETDGQCSKSMGVAHASSRGVGWPWAQGGMGPPT